MTICSICHGGCCRRFNINLTGYDMVKIMTTLEMDLELFVSFHEVNISDEDMNKQTKHFGLLKFSDWEPNQYYRPCLKLVESKLIPNTLKCLFLQEWDKNLLQNDKTDKIIARCGIYSLRPLACAIYPSSLDTTGLIGLTTDPNAFATPSEHEIYNLCPRPLKDTDLPDGSGINIHNLVLQKYELAYFRSITDLWNQNNRKFADFQKYLQAAYANRVVFCNPAEVEEKK